MLAAFLAGAAAYPMVELAWRGRTHPAMALAGGVSLSMLRGLSRVQKSRPLWQQALDGRDNARCVLYPGLNHLMMPSSGRRDTGDYQFQSTVDTQVIDDIAEFVWVNVG